ncbi:MAG: ferredoxin [Actinomycetota bacterium]|nr:ferredoxin [Actinomycetota bacterium]
MPRITDTPNSKLNYRQATEPPEPGPGIDLDQELGGVEFRISTRPHITLDNRVCAGCTARRCLNACPARLFVETSAGEIIFNYENCFECGTCYLVCGHEGALSWNYPPGGYGVRFHRS